MPDQTGFGPCMDFASSLSCNGLRDKTEWLENLLPANYSSTSGNDEELRSTEIPFEDKDPLLIFCNTYQRSAFEAVQVAWALVLKCYTGNDRVSFRYIIDGENVSTKEPGPALSIRSVVFEKGDSILDVFGNMTSHPLPNSSNHYHAPTGDELSGASGLSNSLLSVNWHRTGSPPIANRAFKVVRVTTLGLIFTS
jgi:hypothetical protein